MGGLKNEVLFKLLNDRCSHPFALPKTLILAAREGNLRPEELCMGKENGFLMMNQVLFGALLVLSFGSGAPAPLLAQKKTWKLQRSHNGRDRMKSMLLQRPSTSPNNKKKQRGTLVEFFFQRIKEKS